MDDPTRKRLAAAGLIEVSSPTDREPYYLRASLIEMITPTPDAKYACLILMASTSPEDVGLPVREHAGEIARRICETL